MKVSEATPRQLNYLVAKAECFDCYLDMSGSGDWVAFVDFSEHTHIHYTPSEHWGFGGPIIERMRITVEYTGDPDTWCASIMADEEFYGSTPLIAAMRCYVASKLGDEVDVPKELL